MAALAAAMVAARPAAVEAEPGGRLGPPAVTCSACILVDDTGRTLFARRADDELPNASTTKMVTALVTLHDSHLTDRVTVSPNAAATGGGGLDLHPGDVYSVEGLLYALLLSSSNDAAVALAEHDAGSEDAFVAEMNATARSLGLRHTHFANPHGLDAPGHYSSARDLARIALAVLRRPILARIVATPHAEIRGRAGTIELDNRNVLLESYAGAIGVKTGYTTGAGDVLVAAARRHHRVLIAVAMHSVNAAVDDAALLDYGWERLARGVLVGAGAVVGELVFGAGSTPVVAGRTLRGYERTDALRVSLDPAADLTLPVLPGQAVGRARVSIGGRQVGSVAILATGALGSARSWGASVLSGMVDAVARVLDAAGAL